MTQSRLVLVFVLSALAPALLPHGSRADFEPVTGSSWQVSGRGKAKIKRVGSAVDEGTLDVDFVSDTEVSATDGETLFFDGSYTGGAAALDGKFQKKIVVSLTEEQLGISENALEDIGEDILADEGLPARPDVTITKYKITGKLVQGGDLLKVKVKFVFSAVALGQTRKGTFSANLKGPRVQ